MCHLSFSHKVDRCFSYWELCLLNIYFDLEQIVDYQQVNIWTEDQNIGANLDFSNLSLYFLFFFLGNICLKWKELNMDERMLQTDFQL